MEKLGERTSPTRMADLSSWTRSVADTLALILPPVMSVPAVMMPLMTARSPTTSVPFV
jgi:hypothetical protein